MYADKLTPFSFYVRFCAAWAGLLASFAFSALWALEMTGAWMSCYATAIFFSCLFLRIHHRNLISLSGVFVGLSLTGITLPALPYLAFDLKPHYAFYDSIFLNSLGQLFFVTLALFIAPSRSLQNDKSQLFRGPRWNSFVHANGILCVATLPLVLLAITAAGAWGYLAGDRFGDFDRIASMKGLGPLMIFSVINIVSLLFWACGTWRNGNRWRVLIVVLPLLFLNGFTGGRQNIIFFFIGSLIFFAALQGVNKKILLYIGFTGLAIVLMKVLRVSDLATTSDVPWFVNFFLHFAGDFDSLNNVSVLVDYVRQNGFFGFYHIWSNILVYVPREIFPDKPHDIGGLYLNTHLFPGVYMGADGGTGLALGFQGTWYAAYGLPTLLMGNLLLATCFAWADRRIFSKIHQEAPGLFVFAYIFLMGQSVITYRDGFYSFMNTAFYIGIYYVFLKLLERPPLKSPRF